MDTQLLTLSGLTLITPRIFGDDRGLFLESYSLKRYDEMGIKVPFVQDNVSLSAKNVLRGMHFQKRFPQGKLVSILLGKVYDVVIDLRPDSPTYGQHEGVWLDDVLRQQLYVPPGCAHGFYVVSDKAMMYYKCTEYYHPDDETGVMWNDPAFNIDWPLVGEPVLSSKDQIYVPF